MFNSPDCQLKEDVLPAESPWAYLPSPSCARETKAQFSLLFLYSQIYTFTNDSSTTGTFRIWGQNFLNFMLPAINFIARVSQPITADAIYPETKTMKQKYWLSLCISSAATDCGCLISLNIQNFLYSLLMHFILA